MSMSTATTEISIIDTSQGGRGLSKTARTQGGAVFPRPPDARFGTNLAPCVRDERRTAVLLPKLGLHKGLHLRHFS